VKVLNGCFDEDENENDELNDDKNLFY